MPVHFHDDIPTLQACIVGRTAGLDVLDNGAMNRALSLPLSSCLSLPLQFIPNVRGQVAETQPPTPLPVFSAGGLGASAAAAF